MTTCSRQLFKVLTQFSLSRFFTQSLGVSVPSRCFPCPTFGSSNCPTRLPAVSLHALESSRRTSSSATKARLIATVQSRSNGLSLTRRRSSANFMQIKVVASCALGVSAGSAGLRVATYYSAYCQDIVCKSDKSSSSLINLNALMSNI